MGRCWRTIGVLVLFCSIASACSTAYIALALSGGKGDCSGDITPLKTAVYTQDVAKVAELLKRKPELNQPIEYCGYRTYLQVATAHANYELVKLLIDNGADPKITHPKGEPVLFSVGANTQKRGPVNLPLIRLLVESGAHIRTSQYERDPVLAFAGAEMVEEALLLIELGATLHSTPRNLMFVLRAAQGNHKLLQFAKLMLENGADINALGANGKPELFRALPPYYSTGEEFDRKRLETLRFFLVNGGNPYLASGPRWNLIDEVKHQKCESCVALLRDQYGAIHKAEMYFSEAEKMAKEESDRRSRAEDQRIRCESIKQHLAGMESGQRYSRLDSKEQLGVASDEDRIKDIAAMRGGLAKLRCD